MRWMALERRSGGKVVLVDALKGTPWTVSALTAEALRFGEALARYPSGSRVAFRLPNGAEWMALFLALQRAGLGATPLDGAMPVEGCLDLSRRLGAVAVYLDGEFHALDPAKPLRRRDIACVKITSGTGALPKAIDCRAAHLIADGTNVSKTMGIRSRDINLAAIPLGHSYGLGNLVMPIILQGTAMVCAKEFVPRHLIDWVNRYAVTVFPAVPALLRVLAAMPAGIGDMSSLRTVISAGAMLAPDVARAFLDRFGVKVHNFYGSSETGGICYDKWGVASLRGRAIGKPFCNVSVTIKSRRVVVESAAVATRTGRWRLNDFGEWNSRGELVLLGRAGQGANIGGKKVQPIEIERILRALPGVHDAVVWLERDDGRDWLAAGVETARPRAEIEAALAAQVPAWKMPRSWHVSRDLPRTARGKLDHAALKRKCR
jgi:acyl-coenzyme A synthetase/AMP-(fatty) acid ligase